MPPSRKSPGASVSVPPGYVKTTLVLHQAQWARAKKQAIDEGTDLRTLLLEGLEWRLAHRKVRKKRRRQL